MRSPLVHVLPCVGLTVPTPRRTAYELAVRPVLFRLDPETAHRVTLGALSALSTVLWAADRLGQACEEWADRLERRRARRRT